MLPLNMVDSPLFRAIINKTYNCQSRAASQNSIFFLHREGVCSDGDGCYGCVLSLSLGSYVSCQLKLLTGAESNQLIDATVDKRLGKPGI